MRSSKSPTTPSNRSPARYADCRSRAVEAPERATCCSPARATDGHYFFGHQLKLHRNLNRTENGSPVFDSGEDIALSGREFKTILRKDGLFDLIAYGANTPLGGS